MTTLQQRDKTALRATLATGGGSAASQLPEHPEPSPEASQGPRAFLLKGNTNTNSSGKDLEPEDPGPDPARRTPTPPLTCGQGQVSGLARPAPPHL